MTLRLEILPPWWDTRWFRMTCAGILLALLWAGYQARVRQLHHRFDMKLEARVGERTRIARELHDTLLEASTECCCGARLFRSCCESTP